MPPRWQQVLPVVAVFGAYGAYVLRDRCVASRVSVCVCLCLAHPRASRSLTQTTHARTHGRFDHHHVIQEEAREERRQKRRELLLQKRLEQEQQQEQGSKER